jgi:CxxC motif-containing protein (DUF1111 family)
LSDELLARFRRGRELMARQFVPSTGLGPLYSASSCGGCHEKPAFGGSGSRYRQVFVRTHQTDQTFRVKFQQQFSADVNAALALTPQGVDTKVRNPIPFFGIGLLAEVPRDEILTRVDPSDADGDGISGRVNFERGFVARFGRKAQLGTLQGFVRLALIDHLGLTTQPVDTRDLPGVEGPVELDTMDTDSIADPELSHDDLSDLLAFVALLAAPQPDPPTAQTLDGRLRFAQAGCDACHSPQLQGPHGPLPAFTDLLLHDMGEALADGVEVGDAASSEFRTQPLWGISSAGPYLHDGRADTLDQAIRLHGGEAGRARDRYAALEPEGREALLAFLRSLGGSAYRSDGLLPLSPELPEPGTLGGPATTLDGAARDDFSRGRELFDHDFSIAAGLGPELNGDSCRSCHAAGAIGGSGPSDVDAMRVGVLHDDGTFTPPASGNTLAHRHGIDGERPKVELGMNVFERRQTPPLFGLGLLDGISEATIASRADPDDRDGDGVKGRLSVLSDGRVGRFGWKASAATLAEFTIDALAGELGLTVPDEVRARTPAMVGASTDADAASDPELSTEQVDALVAFVTSLAPPARRSEDAAAEARGQALFQRFGCAACHVPELPGKDGQAVPLFSDLLVHDVGQPEAKRVIDPRVGRGFRTPPLWGLTRSPPYLHDGSAETVDQAIAAHAGEAAGSAANFAQATSAERADLAAFLRSL